jgi:cytoskeletal protein RodZ
MKTSTNTILTKKERQELKKQQKISYKEVKQNKENTIRIIKKSVIIIGILLLSIFIWKLFTAPLDSSEDPKNILQVKSDDWSY